MNENILFRKVPANFLISILNKENSFNLFNISHINKSFDLQYCYNLLNIFVKSDFVIKKEIDGRSFSLELTDKGKNLAHHLIEIKNLLMEVK